jgi:hypothetical protein
MPKLIEHPSTHPPREMTPHRPLAELIVRIRPPKPAVVERDPQRVPVPREPFGFD